MALIICAVINILIIGAICLDICRKTNLTPKGATCALLIIIPHVAVLIYFFIHYTIEQKSLELWQCLLALEGILICTYLWFKVNILPYSKKQPISYRLRILIGGRRLILYSIFSSIVQIILYIFAWKSLQQYSIPPYILVLDIVITILSIATLYLNGMLRILLTSKRINIIKKSIIVSTMLIPFLNLFIIIYVCSVAKSEYEHECYRVVSQSMQIDSSICMTKYPLVLIHGVGFRDFKYINYWGRIPKELIRHGATIYYGNQEAWGTIEYNALDIKAKILDIVKETGVKKVNIIAHSKGGLDARYMISSLAMGEYVASLTMMSTPHRGSRLIDVIYKLPNGMFKVIGHCIDKYFGFLGDKNPDFFTASRQLSVDHAENFNKEVIDNEQVYYQSYATIMNHMFSDYILTLPYSITKFIAGENDGLVTVDSAKWGEFKGVLKNSRSRGISHGDIIDLRKDDYNGFDVRKKYVEIVSELKNSGY